VATHAHRLGTIDLPRPGRSAAPLLGLALLALAFEADRSLRLAGLAAAGCFAVAAVVRAERARRELGRIRRGVDRLILDDPHADEVSDLVRWRTRELVDPEHRAALRRELERTIHQLDPAHLPSSSPLRRAALRRHEHLLRTIATRLGDERPVTPRGILLVRALLRDPGGPFYGPASDEVLARELTRALGALDP
jgi:hypothetical protein